MTTCDEMMYGEAAVGTDK